MPLLAYLSLGLFGCLLAGPLLSGVQATVCRPGWINYQKYCYGYFPQEVTWKEAKALCKRRHGYLGEVVEGKEPEEIAEFLKQRGVHKDVWVEVDFPRGTITTESALVAKLDFLIWTSESGKGKKLPYLCMEKQRS